MLPSHQIGLGMKMVASCTASGDTGKSICTGTMESSSAAIASMYSAARPYLRPRRALRVFSIHQR